MNTEVSQFHCLLCGSLRLHSEVVCDAAELVGKWHSRFGIEVQDELLNVTNILKWHCNECGFAFYDPQLAGTEILYRELQKSAFYYMQEKWEHVAALRFICAGMRVLEIGSGAGAFLEKLAGLSGVTFCGLELNTEAVAAANEKGLNVEKEDLHLYANTHRDSFDAVAHFQVLEHVPDPGAFLSSCVAVLRPGGKLLVGVPNDAGFLRYASDDLLNMPPHHIGLFTPNVFRDQAARLGLKLEKILYEPLADYHLNWYCNVQVDRLINRCRIPWRLVKALRSNLPVVIRRTRLQRFLRGHSLLAVFTKC